MEWFIKALKNPLNFTGRARRKEYWMFTLFVLLFSMVLGIADLLSGLMFTESVGLLSTVFSIAMILPGLAVTIRRLHDTGRSGWWILIALVPIVGVFILLFFTILDSEQGENRFGPNPKAKAAVVPSFQ